MNQKKKTILIFIAIAALVILAFALYNFLSKDYQIDKTGLGSSQESVDKDPALSSNEEKSEPEQSDGADSSGPESESSQAPPSEHTSTGSSQEDPSSSDDPTPEGRSPLPAPDFTVYDLEGQAVSLSDLTGKPVVVNFWASWCPPCRGEMPYFQQAYEKYKDRVHFMMVNVTDQGQETVESASEFIESQGYSFPVYYDLKLEEDFENAASIIYATQSLPSTFLIDKDGNGYGYTIGALEYEDLEKAIEGMLDAE